MRPGSLRQRLTIEKKSIAGSTNDGHFEGNVVWNVWRENVPCSVSVRRGQEHFMENPDARGGQRFSKDIWFFTIRALSAQGIDPTMRVRHKGLVFDIRHIRPDAQYGRNMVIECEVQDAVIGAAPLSAEILSIIPIAIAGKSYAGFKVEASGGEAPYAFEAAGLPNGLAIDADTGEVAGTPAAVGEYQCQATVTDGKGNTAAVQFSISVVAEAVTSYAFSITAGANGSWGGYLRGQIGSISVEPVEGALVKSVVSAVGVAGDGGIEFTGPSEVLFAALQGKAVKIGGSEIAGEWQFSSGAAVWWSAEMPALVSGNTYQIEFV